MYKFINEKLNCGWGSADRITVVFPLAKCNFLSSIQGSSGDSVKSLSPQDLNCLGSIGERIWHHLPPCIGGLLVLTITQDTFVCVSHKYVAHFQPLDA